jgi:peptidyl-tRNA hydrolase, PTH1 family
MNTGNMPETRYRLVVGLGNPGARYDRTRHNAGFLAIDRVAASFSMVFEFPGADPDAAVARGRIDGIDIILAKPLSYMNLSGPPVFRLACRYGIKCRDMLVIHDDIDLAFGRLKIKEKGGDGGHKGIGSLINAFGRDDFTRLRIGIGRSGNREAIVDHVLGEFLPEEAELLDPIFARAREAVGVILRQGAKEGMNRFNSRNFIFSSTD